MTYGCLKKVKTAKIEVVGQNLIIISNIKYLKHRVFKDIGIRKSEFAANTQFLTSRSRLPRT